MDCVFYLCVCKCTCAKKKKKKNFKESKNQQRGARGKKSKKQSKHEENSKMINSRASGSRRIGTTQKSKKKQKRKRKSSGRSWNQDQVKRLIKIATNELENMKENGTIATSITMSSIHTNIATMAQRKMGLQGIRSIGAIVYKLRQNKSFDKKLKYYFHEGARGGRGGRGPKGRVHVRSRVRFRGTGGNRLISHRREKIVTRSHSNSVGKSKTGKPVRPAQSVAPLNCIENKNENRNDGPRSQSERQIVGGPDDNDNDDDDGQDEHDTVNDKKSGEKSCDQSKRIYRKSSSMSVTEDDDIEKE